MMNKIKEIADNMVFTEESHNCHFYQFEDFLIENCLNKYITLYNLTITSKIVPLTFLEKRTLLKSCKRIHKNIRKQKRAVLNNIEEE